MLYIFYGGDDFSIKRELEKIKAGLGDPQMLAVNTVRLDGQHLTLAELEGKCSTVPFMASHRLVIVDGLLMRFQSKRGRQRSTKNTALKEWGDVDSYIKQMPPSTVLVLVDIVAVRDGAKSPLLKKLAPLATVKPFYLLRRKEKIVDWVRQRVSEQGGSINPAAARLLAEFIGGNFWTMDNEISKLLLYAGERTVTAGDVKQLVSYVQEADIFELCDAVAEGKTKLAQQTLQRLYRQGVAPIYILAMITWQFRLIAQVVDMSARLSRQQIQASLNMTEWVLAKILRQAKQYNAEKVRWVYDRLVETDLAIKTGRYNAELALELLLIELSTSRV